MVRTSKRLVLCPSRADEAVPKHAGGDARCLAAQRGYDCCDVRLGLTVSMMNAECSAPSVITITMVIALSPKCELR